MAAQPTVHGTCDAKFQKVQELLEGFIQSGDEVGASISVNIDGKDVVDIWGGYTDENKEHPWDKDTIVNVYSSSKNVIGLAALMLVDRGILDLDERVSHYWPEFGANGKQDVLVRHILGHSSGLSGWEDKTTYQDMFDYKKATERLAAQAPWWIPGTAAGYHATTLGYLLGELVRRTTGKTMKEFVATEIAGPLGADFQIGALEKDWPRISSLIPPSDVMESISAASENGLLEKTFANPPHEPSISSLPGWRNADISAANGHGNARSLSRILSTITLGGQVDGYERLLSEKTISNIFEEQSNGTDVVLGIPIRRGVGFGLTPSLLLTWLPEGRVCYWPGFGGSFVVMDLDRRLTIAYAMNKMVAHGKDNQKTTSYGKAIYEALANN